MYVPTIDRKTAIRAHRVRLGVSQNKLAAVTGIAASNICRIERDAWPDYATLLRIASALSQIAALKQLPGVTIADLVAPLETHVDACR